jgi:hypothetical protein
VTKLVDSLGLELPVTVVVELREDWHTEERPVASRMDIEGVVGDSDRSGGDGVAHDGGRDIVASTLGPLGSDLGILEETWVVDCLGSPLDETVEP